VSEPAWRHGRLQAEGAELHTVELGEGTPVLLVPGWPQSWYAWRHVAPLLAVDRRVVIVEPRGLGDSEITPGGYDLATAASDLRAVTLALDADGPVDIVAHDLGTWISHTLAATSPERVRSMVLVDAGIPGVTQLPSGIPDEAGNIRSWHFGFNRLHGLPELLIAGRERAYLEWLFRSKSVRHDVFDSAALDEYARVLAAPGAIGSGMDYYREAFSADGLAAARERGERRLGMPILTIGASGGVGASLHTAMAERGDRVEGLVFDDCGHYVPEERPGDLVAAVRDFWGRIEGEL
jgi:pimeloyl-ACP methyl ester carboxylesterase